MKLFLFTASILLLISTLEAQRARFNTVTMGYGAKVKGRKSTRLADCVNERNGVNTFQTCQCDQDIAAKHKHPPQAFLSSINFSFGQDRVYFHVPYTCSYNRF